MFKAVEKYGKIDRHRASYRWPASGKFSEEYLFCIAPYGKVGGVQAFHPKSVDVLGQYNMNKLNWVIDVPVTICKERDAVTSL